ncbi:hypothetical protein AVEN_130541-1 [Araneus ventricosus]|uniref:Uncharacterized protein n=1 Tax=Araneus ventricosus TaxID=182803 RepID=A0A4Y2J6H2_ARAVE|nr:hypothetical protein AVEN_130541-1 [Araneus ventricosus]
MDHAIRRWRIPKDFDPVLALNLGFADSRFNRGSIKFGTDSDSDKEVTDMGCDHRQIKLSDIRGYGYAPEIGTEGRLAPCLKSLDDPEQFVVKIMIKRPLHRVSIEGAPTTKQPWSGLGRCLVRCIANSKVQS